MAHDVPVGQLEAPHGAAWLSAALDGRARVEEALPVHTPDVDRLVAVAEHDQMGVGEPSANPALPSGPGPGVVHHADAYACELELQPVGQSADQGAVVVPQHRVHGPATPERLEQVGGDDVAGMEDHVGVLDVLPHVGRQLREVGTEVGVGEDEDAKRRDARIMPQRVAQICCKA